MLHSRKRGMIKASSHIHPRCNASRDTLEKFVFGRERKPEEEFGIYRGVLVARSTDRNVLQVCQDGGVVTTLVTSAMKNKIIDGAAVSAINKHKPLYPFQFLLQLQNRFCNAPEPDISIVQTY